ncbi:HK97 family phage portal protein [Streptococcus urinalis FB127-CNA-2]|uniref:Phage portal protein, HK97 family n=1 Tax=Streptococcus urinalis 2285-97 TaxID=764291 RepID=G5KEJ3_9STRE|nr:phage portal protein [Streptococcus urinalis]QBX22151.1 portal protein [Streptococcus phage Javan637]QBX31607.1 portal protein [Streptococcus phage Javan642]QBX31648.1 portal protein [Streptococcus phage Javan648]EHJ56328.1 phage portal protein, HK97 family [Streptococcus urinalis 2285-97]EKS21891.1 HK97 family phage portal protein [Streptococcus urinalis FB127-CNA-2]
MPVFSFINQITEDPPKLDGEFFNIDDYNFLKPNLSGNEWVSASAALKNSDLFSIINQLSNDLATVKLTASKKQFQGIIDNPTNTANQFGFYQSIFAQLLLGGEAFAYRWRNNNGRDIKWEYLRPSQISFNPLDYENGLYYNISFDNPKTKPKIHVPQNDVLHFRLLSVDGGKSSVSPLMSLSRELNIQKASDHLTLNSLKNALNANGILKIKGGGLLDFRTKQSRARQAMKQMNGGPLVLDDLEDFKPLEIKSNVAQLLNQADWTTGQFAKVYGIPENVVGGQGDQQSSLEMSSNIYAKAVARYLRPVISELLHKLNCDIDTDLFPAVDPTGSNYIKRVNELVKNGVVAQNQGLYMLQQAEIVPKELPQGRNDNNHNKFMKGGDDNGKD